MESVVVANGLSIGYRGGRNSAKALYTDINFELKRGVLTTIMGVNGSGKSTLIKTICGLIPPLAGTITISGRKIESISHSEMSKYLSIVLTERVADGGLGVYDVVAMGRYAYTGFFGSLSQEDTHIVDQSIKDVGIEHLVGRVIADLSDGERQRVMIAKSICQHSDVIILDEPAAFLDIRSRIDIMMLLRRLAKQQNRAVLVSSHDLDLSLQYSDYLWVLSKGDALYCAGCEDMVLSGNIAKIVGDGEGLLFDRSSGIFKPMQSVGMEVEVVGNDVFWIKNALRRDGFMVVESAELKIIARSYTHIEIHYNKTVREANNIESMINIIKTLQL